MVRADCVAGMAGTGLLRNPVCRVIIKVGRLIPVLAILGIIGFSYYVYCFQTVPGECFL